MKLTLFQNKKGLIHGADPKRMHSDRSGILTVGQTQIPLTAGAEQTMPMLFQGCTGEYPASFVTENGERYTLATVTVRGGWIRPPSPAEAELAELRFRLERAEERIDGLSRLFDTNALNFLINERRNTK